MPLSPKGFIDQPYPYHHEIDMVIESVTNLGYGIARDNGWVVQIPFTLPGEKIRGRIFYHPVDRGYEQAIKKRLDRWRKRKNELRMTSDVSTDNEDSED